MTNDDIIENKIKKLNKSCLPLSLYNLNIDFTSGSPSVD